MHLGQKLEYGILSHTCFHRTENWKHHHPSSKEFAAWGYLGKYEFRFQDSSCQSVSAVSRRCYNGSTARYRNKNYEEPDGFETRKPVISNESGLLA
jgi:hypothetical protein